MLNLIHISKKVLFTWLVVFLFLGCNPKANPSDYHTDTTEISDEFSEDPQIKELIFDYKVQLDAKMDEVIGYFAHDMYKKLPESELGNFMCDAPMQYISQKRTEIKPIDFCLMNYGGIRLQHIPEGEVTVETMFELMPFENGLVIVELTGETLQAVMSRVARKGGWPISKNVNLMIENQQVKQFLIDGEPVDYSNTYRVLLTDYVANGGDGMQMLEKLPKEQVNLKLRDSLIEYSKMMTERREPITARINGRVIVVED